MVTKQLRCSGVMEAVRVIAAGYPDRVPHNEILGRFGCLVTATSRPNPEKDGEKVAAVQTLEILGRKQGEFIAGNTKCFLKVRLAAAPFTRPHLHPPTPYRRERFLAARGRAPCVLAHDLKPCWHWCVLQAGVLNDLRLMRERKINHGALFMQSAIRGMIARKQWRVLWEQEQERRRREEEERKRKEEEERLRREEEERKRKEARTCVL